jgi:predicted O-methyltransferase YrrM
MKHLTSVEHNTEWHTKVSEMLAAQQIGNVAYELRRATHDEYPKAEDNYVTVVNEFKDSSLDFVLVDGVQRGYCSKLVIPKLRNGGLLVIDNVNWFIPSNSRSPNSLSMADGSRNGIWQEVYEELASWRRLWTTNGVSDTAIFFKPCRSVT